MTTFYLNNGTYTYLVNYTSSKLVTTWSLVTEQFQCYILDIVKWKNYRRSGTDAFFCLSLLEKYAYVSIHTETT